MKTELIEKLEKLPPLLEKEVEDFVDFLIYKDQKKDRTEKLSDKAINVPPPVFGSGKGIFGKMSDDFDEPLDEKPKLKREAGALKGLVTYMSDDFDAPLKEFHDYMYHISIEFIEKIEKLPVDKQKQIEASVDAMLREVKD